MRTSYVNTRFAYRLLFALGLTLPSLCWSASGHAQEEEAPEAPAEPPAPAEAPLPPPAPPEPDDGPVAPPRARNVPPVRGPARPGVPPRRGVTTGPVQGDDVQPGVADAASKITPFETGIEYEPTSPRAKVTFNLEDADLPDLVRLISQITGKRFILPSKGRSIKATVYAPTKVTAAEAYNAFLSILELNGMALVPAGRYLKIVESGRVEGRAIPLYTADETVPTGDRFLTRLQRISNISAEDASQVLERFKSGDGSITAYAPTNMLIITDTGTNIRRMLRILNVIDLPRTGEQIWVEPVYHAEAGDVAERLTEIFEPGDTGSGKKAAAAPPAASKRAAAAAGAAAADSGTAMVGDAGESRLTKILADERTNSLIILATERAYLRIIEMLKYLDVAIDGEGLIHVHHLQHSDAEEIASTLNALIGGGKGGGGKAAKGATAAAGGSANAVFQGDVAITAHKAANALVITSSSHDYAALRHVIDKIDVERKQVFIEAVIMELNVLRSNSFGVSFHGGVPDVPIDGSLSVVGFQAQNTIGGAASADLLSGLAVGMQGPIIADSQQLIGLSLPAFGVAISAMASSGDANILSTPHLIAMDNVEAEISVGQNVPLQTSGQLTGLGALGGIGAAGLAQNAGAGAAGIGALANQFGLSGSVPRQDVGTTVTITPHINEANEIRLEIAEEISEAGPPEQQGNLGVVSINRTTAKTEVVVRDQQTVVIGGLMRDTTTRSENKVPVLGDLPILGALFRETTNRKAKKNLLLFLTPYIIRSPADLRSIYERKMRERQEFLDRYFVFSDREYEAPMDYSRTRGLLAEEFMELDILAEMKALRVAAETTPKPVHEARAAVGRAPEGAATTGGATEPASDGSEITIEPEGEAPEAPEPVEAPEPAPEPAPEE
jgi:general secretion pathway protein D